MESEPVIESGVEANVHVLNSAKRETVDPIMEDCRPRNLNPPRLPDGWLTYSKYGDPIGDTHIIAMKTPLKEEYDDSLALRGVEPSQERHCLRDFLQTQLGKGRTVSMVIDFTDTTKYYDGPAAERDSGIRYEKLRITGRRPPTYDACRRFFSLVNEFRKENPEHYIAVHCTHGVNRTGFLVISYLCEYMNFSLPDAIDLFEKCRREQFIDHQYLLDELRVRYPVRSMARPPNLPYERSNGDRGASNSISSNLLRSSYYNARQNEQSYFASSASRFTNGGAQYRQRPSDGYDNQRDRDPRQSEGGDPWYRSRYEQDSSYGSGKYDGHMQGNGRAAHSSPSHDKGARVSSNQYRHSPQELRQERRQRMY